MKPRSDFADSLPCRTRYSLDPTRDSRRRGRCRTNRTHIANGPVAHDGLVLPPRGQATSADIPRADDIADTCGRGRDERSRPRSHLHSRSIATPAREVEAYGSGRTTSLVSAAYSSPRARSSHGRADEVTTGATDVPRQPAAVPHVRAAHHPIQVFRGTCRPGSVRLFVCGALTVVRVGAVGNRALCGFPKFCGRDLCVHRTGSVHARHSTSVRQ